MIRGCLGTVAIIVAAIFIWCAWFLTPADKDAIGYYAMMAWYGFWALAVVAVSVGVWRVVMGWLAKDAQQKDGAWKIKKYRAHRWDKEVPWPIALIQWAIGEPGELDRNRITSAAYRIRFNGDIVEHEPACGHLMQHAYNLAVEGTNGVRAALPGDDVRNTWFGKDSLMPRLGGARSLVSRPQAPMPPDEPPALTVASEPALTPQAALDRSADGVVYIGQEREGGRSLARWDANGASTLGIFGANGTGKTSSVATMATLAMVRWGWRLWILDGKDAGDWDEFGNHANVVAVHQSNIEDVMQEVWEEYQRRKQLMSDHRAKKYSALPSEVQAEFPQWGMVFEEYGNTRLRLHQRTRAQLDKFMNILCGEARYTGWHGVFIDQRPSDYTDQMKGNLKAVACFQMQMNQGSAVNAYNAHKLADVGEFEMNNGRYWAFHAEPLARPTLAGVRGSFVDTPVANGYERSTNGYERQLPEANDTNVRERTPDDPPPTLVSIYERTRSWDAVAKSFFERDPEQTQSHLRHLMTLISADGRGPDAFKGEAYRLYHTYNPKGNSYRANQ